MVFAGNMYIYEEEEKEFQIISIMVFAGNMYVYIYEEEEKEFQTMKKKKKNFQLSNYETLYILPNVLPEHIWCQNKR